MSLKNPDPIEYNVAVNGTPKIKVGADWFWAGFGFHLGWEMAKIMLEIIRSLEKWLPK